MEFPEHRKPKPTKRQIKETMDKMNEAQRKQQEAFEKELDTEHTLKLKKRELIVIFNLLTTVNLKYGDFRVIDPIVKTIEPIVAVASNIPPQQQPQENPLVGVKKEVN